MDSRQRRFCGDCQRNGCGRNVQDAGADAKEQISQIEYFISKQVDVIVVIARDCGALSDVIQKARMQESLLFLMTE